MMIALAEVEKNIKNVTVEMNKRILHLLLFTFVLSAVSLAQNEIVVDPKIDAMLDAKLNALDSNNTQGYRIQIFYGNELQQANRTESQFKLKFPEWNDRVYKIYQRPNYRVRVGDFKREIDAQLLLSEVIKHFPSSFIVKGKIKAPDL